MAIIELSIPSPGEAIHEVVIARWLKNPGDIVEKDEVLAEIDTDKVSMTLHAQESGVLSILVHAGPVNVGVVIAKIDTDIPSHVIKSIVNVEQLIDTKLDQIEEFNNIFDKTVKQVKVGDYLFFMKNLMFLADISFIEHEEEYRRPFTTTRFPIPIYFSYQKVWGIFRDKYNMSDEAIQSFLQTQIFLKYGYKVFAY